MVHVLWTIGFDNNNGPPQFKQTMAVGLDTGWLVNTTARCIPVWPYGWNTHMAVWLEYPYDWNVRMTDMIVLDLSQCIRTSNYKQLCRYTNARHTLLKLQSWIKHSSKHRCFTQIHAIHYLQINTVLGKTYNNNIL